VAGVNRIGKDGNGLEYNGCSAIIDFEGVVLQEEINHEKVLHSRISLSALKEAREKFPVLVDQSNFTIHE
jgi:predicted amidohydrolase